MLFSPALATYGDKLTAFGSESITYDEYGRTSRYRGKNIFYGGYDAHNISYFGNASFTYYEDGMRRTKTVGGVTHYYTYEGINLIREEWGNNTLVFLYDAGGLPIGMQYRNSSYASGVWDTYYYEKNLQGDVIAVYSAAGTKLVTYDYDAWGDIYYTTYFNGGASTAAVYNPLKYRSYYYDDDLDLYYLATRYYDPEVCRFVTADDPAYLGANGDLVSYNLYAYCSNNPVMYIDPTGHSITLACIIIGAAIGTVSGGCVGAYVSQKQTGNVDGWAVVAGAIGGGVIGGLIGWGVGAAITAVGATITGSASTATAPIVKQVAEKASTALQTYYPPNDGFSGVAQKITLEAGTLIQRTGDLVGRYIAPAGTPTQMLSLPYDKIGQPTTILQVQRSVEVLAGRVAPWFGQIGGGIQYKLRVPLDQLLSEGIIKILGS